MFAVAPLVALVVALAACKPTASSQSDPDSLEGVKRALSSLMKFVTEADWTFIRQFRHHPAFEASVKHPGLRGWFALLAVSLDVTEKARIVRFVRDAHGKGLRVRLLNGGEEMGREIPSHTILGLTRDLSKVRLRSAEGLVTDVALEEVQALHLRAVQTLPDGSEIPVESLVGGKDIRGTTWESVDRPGSYSLDHFLGAGSFGAVFKASGGPEPIAFKVVDMRSFDELVPIPLLNSFLKAITGGGIRTGHDRYFEYCAAHGAECGEHLLRIRSAGTFKEAKNGLKAYAVVSDLAAADASVLTKGLSLEGNPADATSRIEALKDVHAHLTRAVDSLSRAGFVHMDVKPQNIVVKEGAGGPRLQLADFDGMRKAGEGFDVHAGDYSGPEVFRSSSGENGTDHYSVGATIVEFITGKSPARIAREHRLFDTDALFQVPFAKLHSTPLGSAKVLAAFTAELDRVGESLPAKDRAAFVALKANVLKQLSADPAVRMSTDAARRVCSPRFEEALRAAVASSRQSVESGGAGVPAP